MENNINGALEAIEAIECDNDSNDDRLIAAFQFLIDSQLVWDLQGWYQRTARYLIREGYCHD